MRLAAYGIFALAQANSQLDVGIFPSAAAERMALESKLK